MVCKVLWEGCHCGWLCGLFVGMSGGREGLPNHCLFWNDMGQNWMELWRHLKHWNVNSCKKLEALGEWGHGW